MIYPVVEVVQESASILRVTDVTPDYSIFYTGGFGIANPDRSEMLKFCSIVYLGGQGYEIEKDYDQQTGLVELDSNDITLLNQFQFDKNCPACNSQRVYSKNKDGSLSSFPSGCVNLDVYFKYFDVNTGQMQCTEKSSMRLVLYYNEEQSLIRVFNTFPFDVSGCGKFSSEDERKSAINDLMLAWSKLQNIGKLSDCSCECVEDTINSVSNFILNTKWITY